MIKRCSGCKYFDCEEAGYNYDDYICICYKGHFDHVGWYTTPCEDYEESK